MNDRYCRSFAGVAHLVERHLAKVEVAGSSPVARSMEKAPVVPVLFCMKICGGESNQNPHAMWRGDF